VRIGLAAHTLELTALFGQLREGLRNHLDAAGLNYEWFEGAPETSASHQQFVQILEDMATLELDYLVVGPTSLALNEPGLMTVAAAGTKLSMTDYERPEEGVPYDDAVLNWVVYSHSEMGFKSGEWLGDELRARGVFAPKVAILWGPAASDISQQRGDGVKAGLEELGDLDVDYVYEAHADFNRDIAYTETERALAAYDFDAIVGMNSATAVSAKNALHANGRHDIIVIGMGGIVEELESVALREIGVAPFRDPHSMGRASADAILKDLTGRTDEIQRTFYADIPVLDSAYRIRQHVPPAVFDVAKFLASHHGRG
jgi:ABC-type sugar transport system substrate-binding protein